MTVIFETTEFMLALVLGSYIIGRWVYHKTKITLLHPIIISITLIISFLKTTGIDYATFEKGSEFISFLLGPVVVALGYLLYEKLEYLKQNASAILTSVFVGCIVGIVSVIFLATITGTNQVLIYSLEPKSVTIPIAINISASNGGNIALTVAAVVISGIFGSIVGPSILQLLGIKSSVAKGLAIGSAAHGIGTGRAMELGEVEGALSGLAIGLMGVMTAILIPILHLIFGY